MPAANLTTAGELWISIAPAWLTTARSHRRSPPAAT